MTCILLSPRPSPDPGPGQILQIPCPSVLAALLPLLRHQSQLSNNTANIYSPYSMQWTAMACTCPHAPAMSWPFSCLTLVCTW